MSSGPIQDHGQKKPMCRICSKKHAGACWHAQQQPSQAPPPYQAHGFGQWAQQPTQPPFHYPFPPPMPFHTPFAPTFTDPYYGYGWYNNHYAHPLPNPPVPPPPMIFPPPEAQQTYKPAGGKKRGRGKEKKIPVQKAKAVSEGSSSSSIPRLKGAARSVSSAAGDGTEAACAVEQQMSRESATATEVPSSDERAKREELQDLQEEIRILRERLRSLDVGDAASDEQKDGDVGGQGRAEVLDVAAAAGSVSVGEEESAERVCADGVGDGSGGESGRGPGEVDTGSGNCG